MKKLITLMSLAVVGLTFGQEEEPKFNVTGSVDAYFHTSLNGTNEVSLEDGYDAGAFTSAPSAFMGNDDRGFSGGNVNLKLSYEGEKVGFVADLAYGPRANAQFSDFDVVNEAYMYWNASEKVTLMMGRWNSWMGYENFAAADNFHYSYSYDKTKPIATMVPPVNVMCCCFVVNPSDIPSIRAAAATTRATTARKRKR